MTRAQLEHLIRAAGTIADVDDVVVIGSQAILGEFPDAAPAFLVSMEAALFPRDHPERTDLIDDSIGEGSPFQATFGYFAHGVGEGTAILAAGWRERLILVTGENTRFIRGWCLEIHDLAIRKHVAGREKDIEFTELLVQHGMVRRELLEQRLEATIVDPAIRQIVRQRIARQFRRNNSEY